MSREEKMNKMIEEIKIRRNDEQYRGGPFPIYHIEFDILNEEIERLKTELQDTKEHLGEYLHEQEEENNRLNNIINELEKWLDKKEKLTFNSWNKGIHEVQRKLQELKGSDK